MGERLSALTTAQGLDCVNPKQTGTEASICGFPSKRPENVHFDSDGKAAFAGYQKTQSACVAAVNQGDRLARVAVEGSSEGTSTHGFGVEVKS